MKKKPVVHRGNVRKGKKQISALSIDCLIFGFQDSKLQVLLVQHGEGIIRGKWALPGGWVTYDESVDAAADRLLRSLTGVENVYLEQLRAFGAVDRYPGKRVITIAYFALIRPENYPLIPGYTASDAAWYEIHEVPDLPFDHNEILEFGYSQLKRKVKYEPVGFNLLPRKFTLLELQELYEAILEVKMDKPNFRRKMRKMHLLLTCDEKQEGVSHRAAALYRFDKEVYDKLRTKGFIFDL